MTSYSSAFVSKGLCFRSGAAGRKTVGITKPLPPTCGRGPTILLKKLVCPFGAARLFSAKILPARSENIGLVANKSASASCEPKKRFFEMVRIGK